jgi:hypothetical protein
MLQIGFIVVIIAAICYSLIRDMNNKYYFPKVEIIKTYLDIVKDVYINKLFLYNDLNINDEIKNNVNTILDEIILVTSFIDFDEYVDHNTIYYPTIYNNMDIIYHNNSMFNETENLFNKTNIKSNKYRMYYLNSIYGLKEYNNLNSIMNHIFLKNLFDLSEVYFKFVNEKINDLNFPYSNITYFDNIDKLNKIVSNEIKFNNDFNIILDKIDYKYQFQILQNELIKFYNISTSVMQPTVAPI